MQAGTLKNQFWQSAVGEGFSSLLSRHWTAAKGVLALTFLAAGAHDNRTGLFSTAALSQTTRTVLHAGLFKRMISLINKIDDVVDNMTAEQRLALGTAELGNEPCAFLQSPELGLAEYFGTIDAMDAARIISAQESYSFGNIYCSLLYQGAEAEMAFRETGAPEARQVMTESNMQIAQVLGGHILHHFIPDREIKEKAKDSALTPNDVMAAYPAAMRLGYMIEMCDDLGDFFTDMEREAATGILSPNWIATDLAVQGQLYAADGGLNPVLSNFLVAHHSNPGPLSFTTAPEPVRLAVEKGQQDMLQRAATLPPFEAQSIMIIWDSIKKAGLKSSRHPDVLKGSVLEGNSVYNLG